MSDLVAQLPPEIRLAGYAGPTLFTSEVHGGELRPLATFDVSLRRHAQAASPVIGTIRETQGAPIAYAAFCVEPGTGYVVIVDLDPPHVVRFVNRSVEQLVATLRAVADGWPRAADDETALRGELAAIDPAALADDDAFWPTCLETLGADELSTRP